LNPLLQAGKKEEEEFITGPLSVLAMSVKNNTQVVTPRFPKCVETESRRRSATYVREKNTHAHTLSLK